MNPKYIITFKNNGGRTGNLIFEYMICKLIEIKLQNTHKYITYSLDLDFTKKEDWFIITDNNIHEVLQFINRIQVQLQNKHIVCDGYFQKSTFFIQDRVELIERMRESTEDYWILNDTKYYITDFFKETPRFSVSEQDVVISLRLDDFIQYPCPTSDIIPPKHYLDILEDMSFKTLYIICDKLKHDWEYKYMEYFKKWNPVYVIGDTLYKDGAFMRDCPVFIHSNSTFSWLMSFFSRIPYKKRYIPCTNMYKVQELGSIESTDIVYIVKPLTHQAVHELNYIDDLKRNIYSLSYCIPDEKINHKEHYKITNISTISVSAGNAYEYDETQEKEYYQQYQDARFAMTKKKGGWDCLRHYEILANGCIPIFDELEKCPKNTMITLPKHELIEISKQRDFFVETSNWTLEKEYMYSGYYHKIMKHFRENCTTSANAKYILSKLSKPREHIKNILMLCCDSGVNYLREMTWIGMKRWIREKKGISVEYPKLSYLYEDYSSSSTTKLYGNGFTYSKCLSVDDDIWNNDQRIIESIEKKKWDLIIYGKTGPDELELGSIPFLPFWEKVSRNYNKKEIVFLYGGDECFDMSRSDKYSKHLLEHANYGTCFVRELV